MLRSVANVTAIIGSLLVVNPVDAFAGEYVVTTCRDAPGAVNNAWNATVTDQSTVGSTDGCKAENEPRGLWITENLGTGPYANAGDQGWWNFAAPTGAIVTSASLDRYLYSEGDPGWQVAVQADAASLEECTSYVGINYNCGRGGEGGARIGFGGLAASTLRVGGVCVPQPYSRTTCARGHAMHSLTAVFYGASVTVDDQEAPAVGISTVAGVDMTRWHNGGSADVTFEAADNTGIRRRGVEVGGVEVASETAPGPSASTPGCGELNEGVAYTFTRPCADGRGVNGVRTLAIPLSAAPEGTQVVQGVATDTGGLTVRGAGVEVKVDRTAPVAPAPGVAGGSGWSDAAGAAVEWTVPVEGDRAPITGVELELYPAGAPCAVMDKGSRDFGAAVSHAIASLPEGTSTVRVRHADAAGNTGAWSAATAIRRDRSAPAIEVVRAPVAEVAARTELSFEVVASDAGAGVHAVTRQLQVDGGAWQPYLGAPIAVAGRTYRFRAKAVDGVGRESSWVTSGATTVRAPAATADPAAETAPILTAPSVVVPPSIVTPQSPTPPQVVARQPAALRVASATLRGASLQVAGTSHGSGRVTVSFTARGHTVRRAVGIRAGRWSATLPLGRLRGVRSGKLVVRQASDEKHLEAVVARTLRRR